MGKKRPFLPRLNSSFFAFSNSSRVYFLPSIHMDLTPNGNSKNIKRLFTKKTLTTILKFRYKFIFNNNIILL